MEHSGHYAVFGKTGYLEALIIAPADVAELQGKGIPVVVGSELWWKIGAQETSGKYLVIAIEPAPRPARPSFLRVAVEFLEGRPCHITDAVYGDTGGPFLPFPPAG